MPKCPLSCCLQDSTNNDERDNESLLSSHHVDHCKDYESLDYDKCYNRPYRELVQQISQQNRGIRYDVKKEILSWFSIFIIGILTALVAFFIDSIIKLLTHLKLSTVNNFMVDCPHWSCVPQALFVLLAFNLLFVGIAAFLVVYGEPLAAGSGIPEIKCYLNGVKVRNVTRFRTLVCKAVGVLFSVSGGLLVGKEGPMIHSGGVIGAGVPQFESFTFRGLKLKLPFFRSDRDKRDFVSAGAAAGVAAAFGAPIGGVLFSLEEGSSFWNQSLTWKTLFCTMTSTFTLNFFLSGTQHNSWGSFYQNGLLTFGVFQCPPDNTKCHLWTAKDLLLFIVMGFGGGIFGLIFNAINTKITVFRLHYLAKKPKIYRLLEALFVGMATTLVAYLSPLFIGDCKKMTSDGMNASTADEVQRFLCPNNSYNDMATLFYNPQETAIKQLFHHSGEFSLLTLGIFFIFFFLLSCWTYGASVPSGLFVPCILCGAAYGRFVANFLSSYFGMDHIYLGTFSLIGAAAFLGGVVRMTISLTVILIECTNEITLSLPIMVTLMVAKWAGDIVNEGLYDIHIHLKSVPLLEWESPSNAADLDASDIMNTRLKFVFPYTRVRSIINLLRTTAHNSFPVVTMAPNTDDEVVTCEGNSPFVANQRYRSSSVLTRLQVERHRARTLSHNNTELVPVELPINDESSEADMTNSTDSWSTLHDNLRPLTFHGMILRTQLTTLLKNHIDYKQQDGPQSQMKMNYNEMNRDYPRFSSVHDLDWEGTDQNHIMDLTPYMHPCPHIAHPDSPVPQVFNLFRTMGLRHLPVVNSTGEVLGIITRHNLTHHYIEEISKKMNRAQNTVAS
uniref:Chloride channel protein n=1 Tax=Phallusia mammillata TaxID=59560 RepID=A0A6F9DA92_9ASCI|nr:chloride transport protein 6-like [Phallusia mammillata]